MKKVLLGLVVAVMMTGLSYPSSASDKMITIEEYFATKYISGDPGSLEYVFFRCIGLNNMQRTVAETRTDDLGKQTVQMLNNSYDILVMIAFSNYKISNPGASFDKFASHTIKATQPLGQLYQEIANNSWLKSGQYFSDPLILSDMKICGGIIQELGGNN